MVFAAGLVIAFFRLGWTGSLRGVVWAEDGSVFLQSAHNSAAFTDIFEPYAGYANTVPRVLAEVVSHFPLPWQGLMISLAGAVGQAAIGLLAYHVIRAHAPLRLAAVTAALAVVAVPVGPEVVDNVANLQWFVIVGGCIAPLWSPRRRTGRIASIVAVLAATTTSPFGAVVPAMAALVWLATRRRDALVLLGAALAGTVAQVIVILTAPPRPTAANYEVRLLVAGYARRVVGDAILGIGRHHGLDAPQVKTGLLIAMVLTMVVVALVVTQGPDPVVLPILLALTSVALFAVPVGLSGYPTISSVNPGRYYVAPAIFLLISVGLLAEAALGGGRRPLAIGVTAVMGTVMVGVAYGLVTSWPTFDFGRTGEPAWADQVADARIRCESAPPETPEQLMTAPTGWFTTLSCSQIVDGHQSR